MASGLTHILLVKDLLNRLPENEAYDEIQMLLSAAIAPLEIGAVAPDLPYAGIADDDLFLTTQSMLADKFHYERTNEVALRALRRIRSLGGGLTPTERREHVAFFLGFISHLVADGVIHPFVRDKVGDYTGHEKEHRVLEMQLDVLSYQRFAHEHGAPGNINDSNLHDELRNFEPGRHAGHHAILEMFAGLAGEVYGVACTGDMVAGWIGGLHRMFGIAEGRRSFYHNFGFISSYFLPDPGDLADRQDEILTLRTPVDRAENFLRTPEIHFFRDVVPKFYERFIPIIAQAHAYIYHDGPELTPADLPPIDLDNGRNLAVNGNLDETPSYWA